jgi:hypothetical protein
MFSSSESKAESKWESFAEVEAAFAKVLLNTSDTNDLKRLGFHPSSSPNVKILTYVDIINFFMPNPGIRKEDLDEPVRACIDAKDEGHAYLVELRNVNAKRHGNLFLDIFGFKRRTHETGWEFRGIILMTNSTVVYKLSSGQPRVSRNEKRTKPLGPFQEVDVSPSSAARMIW